jgi:hypothetical protein
MAKTIAHIFIRSNTPAQTSYKSPSTTNVLESIVRLVPATRTKELPRKTADTPQQIAHHSEAGTKKVAVTRFVGVEHSLSLYLDHG